jgi:hypothetical protein
MIGEEVLDDRSVELELGLHRHTSLGFPGSGRKKRIGSQRDPASSWLLARRFDHESKTTDFTDDKDDFGRKRNRRYFAGALLGGVVVIGAVVLPAAPLPVVFPPVAIGAGVVASALLGGVDGGVAASLGVVVVDVPVAGAAAVVVVAVPVVAGPAFAAGVFPFAPGAAAAASPLPASLTLSLFGSGGLAR